MRRSLLAGVFALALCHVAGAQPGPSPQGTSDALSTGSYAYEAAGAASVTVRYRVRCPAASLAADSAAARAAADRLPMVVLLHGRRSPRPEPYAWGILSSPAVRSRHPAVLLAPELDDVDLRDPPWEEAVMRLIDRVANDYAVDRRRIYLAGEAEGATAVWELIAAHPGRFAAAVTVSGDPSGVDAAPTAHVPHWAFHGASNDTIPADAVRRAVSDVWAAGGREIRYTELAREGYAAWGAAWDEPRLVPWLFSHRQE